MTRFDRVPLASRVVGRARLGGLHHHHAWNAGSVNCCGVRRRREATDAFFPSLDGIPLEAWFIPADSEKLLIVNHPMTCNRYGFPGHLPPWNMQHQLPRLLESVRSRTRTAEKQDVEPDDPCAGRRRQRPRA